MGCDLNLSMGTIVQKIPNTLKEIKNQRNTIINLLELNDRLWFCEPEEMSEIMDDINTHIDVLKDENTKLVNVIEKDNYIETLSKFKEQLDKFNEKIQSELDEVEDDISFSFALHKLQKLQEILYESYLKQQNSNRIMQDLLLKHIEKFTEKKNQIETKILKDGTKKFKTDLNFLRFSFNQITKELPETPKPKYSNFETEYLESNNLTANYQSIDNLNLRSDRAVWHADHSENDNWYDDEFISTSKTIDIPIMNLLRHGPSRLMVIAGANYG